MVRMKRTIKPGETPTETQETSIPKETPKKTAAPAKKAPVKKKVTPETDPLRGKRHYQKNRANIDAYKQLEEDQKKAAKAFAKKQKKALEERRGIAFADLVPPYLQNILPDIADIEERDKFRPENARRIAQLKAMTRRFAPLGFLVDSDVVIADKTFRLAGLNQARFNALIGALASGATNSLACKFAGIGSSTFSEWMNKGRNGQFPYSYVSQAIEEATASLKVDLISSLLDAGLSNQPYTEVTKEYDGKTKTMQVTKEVEKYIPRKWQALAWFLERTDPSYQLKPQNAVEDDADIHVSEKEFKIMEALTLGTAVLNEKDLEND